MADTKIPRASFSLEKEYQDLLNNLAKGERRTMTEVLRMLIDFYAVTKGHEPINPVDPKTFTPARELALNTPSL